MTGTEQAPEEQAPEIPDPQERLTATALVTTDRPERYAKQLASHLGRKLQVTELSGGGTRLDFPDRIGHGVLAPGSAGLQLTAVASEAEALARIKDVVGRHLEQFGERDGLVVTWEDAGPS